MSGSSHEYEEDNVQLQTIIRMAGDIGEIKGNVSDIKDKVNGVCEKVDRQEEHTHEMSKQVSVVYEKLDTHDVRLSKLENKTSVLEDRNHINTTVGSIVTGVVSSLKSKDGLIGGITAVILLGITILKGVGII